MACNCKRIKNFDELRQELDNNAKTIRVSIWMKFLIFLRYLLFSFFNVIIFGYNLFRSENIKEWIKV